MKEKRDADGEKCIFNDEDMLVVNTEGKKVM